MAGVPQGSVLGPLLFLIFINDITEVVRHMHIKLFADDTCLHITVENRDETAALVNSDLQALHEWSERWLVTFSPPKTQSLIVSNKSDYNKNPPLTLNQSVIAEVTEHKHLGIVLERNLKWNSQIDSTVTKAMKRLDIIQSFKFKLCRSALERFYRSFVLPLLEYGDIVWSGSQEYEIIKLDAVQNRAMRIVTGATEKSNINNMYEDLGWQSLRQRREIHCLKWMYRIVHKHCPSYLSDVIPPTVGERQRYNLRGNHDLSTIQATTQTYSKSFFPSTIRLWNTLPLAARESSTCQAFYNHLLNLDSYKPRDKYPWYGAGERRLNITHTRIRLGCSALKAQLHYNLRVEDSPYCNYCPTMEEDPYHFFFVCPRYVNERTLMFGNISHLVNVPRLHTLLCGDVDLSTDDNKSIFNSVQNFIRDTDRFV